MINDVVEECFSYMLYHPGKKDEEAEAIIDEAADLKSELSTRINESKVLENASGRKKLFREIRDELASKRRKLQEAVTTLDK